METHNTGEAAKDVRCYHCQTIYSANDTRCPRCGLSPEDSRYNETARRIARQAGCPHTGRTPTTVGGFTCDDCGIYLFR
jgi:hypothetical protein